MNLNLTVTSLYASLLAVIYVGLSLFVIRRRWQYSIGMGTAENRDMEKAIRIHGNFQEYVPLGLILLFLLEIQGRYPSLYLHLLGGSLLLGRILHLLGILKTRGPSPGRFAGMILTFLYLLLCSGLLLV